jgi:hypothetical protein
MVAPLGVDAVGVDVAVVLSRAALVQFGTVEFVNSSVPRETLAGVRPGSVDAPSVLVAVVAFQASLLLTLVDIWTELAAVVGDAELLVWRTSELGTHRLRVYPRALHAAVLTLALDALLDGH